MVPLPLRCNGGGGGGGGGGGVKVSTKWRKYKQTCFDVVFSSKNMLIYTCFPVFSPFNAHFTPPPPHYIIIVKGPLLTSACVPVQPVLLMFPWLLLPSSGVYFQVSLQ